MAWRVERQGRGSTPASTPGSVLIGAAHFFPRSFRRDLRRLIGEARIVLLEGPLDEEATRKVLAAGRGAGWGTLYEAAKEEIDARLGIGRSPLDLHQLLKDLVFGRQEQWLEEEMRALKPWAAFFGVWTRYRITVEGTKARLYVHGAAQPCLIVNDLKLGDSTGGVLLWIGPGTEGYFSGLKIQSK